MSRPTVTRKSKAKPEVERQLNLDKPDDQPARAKPYCLAQIAVQLSQWEELHSVGSRRLADWIWEVVKVESPVHIQEVARRITNAAGLKRVGNRILSAIEQAAKLAERNGRLRIKADILLDPSATEIAVRDRSELPPAFKKIEWVAPVEIAAAIASVVERSCGIERAEAVISAARLLGFQRTGTGVESTIAAVLESMLKKGILTVEGKFVLLKKEG